MNRRHFTGLSPFRQRPCWGLFRAFPQGSMRTIATPLGSDRACHTVPLSGSQGTPFFWGGRYRPPRLCWFGTGETDGQGRTTEE